jgi:type I restriction enzyme, S subunit
MTEQQIEQNIALNLPAPEEQRKIADCLSAVDIEFTAQAAKIDALKQRKLGFLQQPLPAPVGS